MTLAVDCREFVPGDVSGIRGPTLSNLGEEDGCRLTRCQSLREKTRANGWSGLRAMW